MIAVLAVLAALVLGIAQSVQDRGARSRAEAEIAAIAVACESYRVDNGIYPQTANTDTLDPNVDFDASQSRYQNASADLYSALTGTAASTTTQYFQFKPNMLNLTAGPAIIDPYENYYGYSTAHRNNPTLDLWSTADEQVTTVNEQIKWIKNW